MVDFKTEAINLIVANSVGFLSVEQQKKLRDTLDISLYDYDLYRKEDGKELPATLIEQNLMLVKYFFMAKSVESKSPKTLELYRTRIMEYINFVEKPLGEVVPNDIRYYLAYTQKTRGISNTTLENIRVILSSFFSWLSDEGYIQRNPVSSINAIKRDTKKELPFSQHDIEAMRKSCTNLRDRALIEFMLSTGCRCSEIISVNRSQVDYIEKQLIVKGKGNKERIVYLSDTALFHLKNYLETRTDDNEALFIGVKAPYSRLGNDAIENIVKKIGKKAGVEKVHPHRFRRTFCCNNLDKGMPIQNVQEIMGHTKVDTTLIYYNMTNDNIKRSFQAINN